MYGFINGSFQPIHNQSFEQFNWIDFVYDSPISNLDILPFVDKKVVHQLFYNRHQSWSVKDDCFYIKLFVINRKSVLQHKILLIILTKNLIVTIRQSDSDVFEEFYKNKHTSLVTCPEIMLAILNDIVENVAYILETQNNTMTHLYNQVMSAESAQLKTFAPYLKQVSKMGHLFIAAQEVINHYIRVLDFLYSDDRLDELTGRQQDFFKDQIHVINQAVITLNGTASYMVQNLSYISQTVMGALSLKQNEMVKLLSFLGVMFVPASFIVSLWETHEAWGLYAVLSASFLFTWAFISWWKRT